MLKIIITMYNKISILELEWQLRVHSSERFQGKNHRSYAVISFIEIRYKILIKIKLQICLRFEVPVCDGCEDYKKLQGLGVMTF